LFALAVSLLAGSTVDRLRSGAPRRGAVLAASLGCSGLVFWAYSSQWRTDLAGDLGSLYGLWLGAQVGATLLVGLLLLPTPASHPQSRWPRWCGVALLAVVASELLVFHRPLNPPVNAALFFPRTEAVEWLQEYQRERPGARVVGHHAALPPQIASLFGLYDPRSSGPSLPTSVAPLLQPLLLEPRGNQLDARVDHPLFDLFAVHQVIGSRGMRQRSGVYRRGNTQIWARGGAPDQLFLPPTSRALEVTTQGGAVASYDANAVVENVDFRQLAYVSTLPQSTSGTPPFPVPEQPWAAQSVGDAAPQLVIERVDSGRLVGHVESPGGGGLPEPRLLATSIYQDGNWVVRADGNPAPRVFTNGPLLGAWLPAGTRRVEVLYRPAVVAWSALGAGLAGLLLVGIAVAWRE
jgi:hypothetical protein